MNNKERIDYIKKNIKITDFAEQNGFKLKKVGSYFTLKEHDSVRIDPVKNCYWQNSNPDNSGSIFDFAINMCGYSFKDCMVEFSKGLNFSKKDVSDKADNKKEEATPKILELPEKNDNYKQVIAYLIKTRGIDREVVFDFIDRKLLYQDTNGNCVFIGYDFNNKPVFATKRGTNSNKKYFSDVKSSDYSKGFFVDNNSDVLVVTESVIDLMSVCSLSENNNDYLALCGVGKWEAIDTYLYTNKYYKVCIALDNDQAGKETATKIKEHILNNYSNIEPVICLPYEEYGKDWNDYLIHERKENNAIRKIR